jgi:hypothetical protein
VSAAGRARIAEAQRKRWAESKAASQSSTPEVTPKPKRKLSEAGRKAIVAATKKRWRGAEEGRGCEDAKGHTEEDRRQEGCCEEDGHDLHAGRGENRQLKKSDGADCYLPFLPLILIRRRRLVIASGVVRSGQVGRNLTTWFPTLERGQRILVRGKSAIINTRDRRKNSGVKAFWFCSLGATAHATDSRLEGQRVKTFWPQNASAATMSHCFLWNLTGPLHHRYQCQEFGKRENRFRRRIVLKGSTKYVRLD